MPDAVELLHMIKSVESPRLAVDRGFIEKYDQSGVLDSFRELERQTGVEDIFGIDRKMATLADFHNALEKLHAAVRVMTSALEEREFDPELTSSVYDALAAQDQPERADAIFVFGAPSNARIEKAIQLYKLGLADRLIISGREPNWSEHQGLAEAERMAEVAVEAGIPEADMIVETRSVSIPDNVKRSLDLFEQINFYPKTMIIVTSGFAILRSVTDWEKFAPRPIKLIRVAPPVVNQDLGRDRWSSSDAGRRVVVNEYAKLVNEALIDELLVSDAGRKILG
jgi:hypothetical protein